MLASTLYYVFYFLYTQYFLYSVVGGFAAGYSKRPRGVKTWGWGCFILEKGGLESPFWVILVEE